MLAPSPHTGTKSPFSRSLICTGARRNPATCGKNQENRRGRFTAPWQRAARWRSVRCWPRSETTLSGSSPTTGASGRARPTINPQTGAKYFFSRSSIFTGTRRSSVTCCRQLKGRVWPTLAASSALAQRAMFAPKRNDFVRLNRAAFEVWIEGFAYFPRSRELGIQRIFPGAIGILKRAEGVSAGSRCWPRSGTTLSG